jgi:hypothetical protein
MPVLVGMGDPVCGPLVGLFFDAPSTPEQLAGPPDLAPAHSHPCDNFRVVMKGELIVGQERYRHGEFRLQRTGRPYGRDGDAPHAEGNWRIIFFADRRGHRVRPTNPALRREYASAEAVAQTKARFGEVLPVILPDEDDGVDGLVTTIDKPFSRLGHIDGSFDDSTDWDSVGESSLAVTLMGVHDVGPVVLLQRTPAGALATPRMTWDSDVFRCVVGGSAKTEGGKLLTGDTEGRAAGYVWPAVQAGPEGLDELVVVADRRGAAPHVVGERREWGDAVVETVERLTAQLHLLTTA